MAKRRGKAPMRIMGIPLNMTTLIIAIAGYIGIKAYGSKIGGMDKTLDDVAAKLPGAGPDAPK